MSTAVKNQKSFNHPYAIIAEDDIRFAYCIDFLKLARSAPKDFTALQLVTSKLECVSNLWKNYLQQNSAELWERRDSPAFWGSLVYIVDTRKLSKFLKYANININGDAKKKAVFEYNLHPPPSLLAYCNTNKSIGTTYPRIFSNTSLHIKNSGSKLQRVREVDNCNLSFPISAETYLFEWMYPTFISRLGFAFGSPLSRNSTLHQDHVELHHVKAFRKIVSIREDIKSNNSIQKLPPGVLGFTDSYY